jgi:hypothetical protein
MPRANRHSLLNYLWHMRRSRPSMDQQDRTRSNAVATDVARLGPPPEAAAVTSKKPWLQIGAMVAWLVFVTPLQAARPAGSETNPPADAQPTDPLVGVWSNEKEGFQEGRLAFFGAQPGQRNGGVIMIVAAAGYFYWDRKPDGIVELQTLTSPSVTVTLKYDPETQVLALVGPKNPETFTKTDEPLPEDPIASALREERESQRRRRENMDTKTLDSVDAEAVVDRFDAELNRGGEFYIALFDEDHPDRSLLSLHWRDDKLYFFLRMSEALDKSLPRKFARRSGTLAAQPQTTLPIVVYVANADAAKIKAMLDAQGIACKEGYRKIDYLDGYKTGFRHGLSGHMTQAEARQLIGEVVTLLSEGRDDVEVRVLRRNEG